MDPVSVSLLEILNELVEEDVKRFKWHLNQDQFGPEFPPIPKGQLEKADRSDTVDYMVKNYRESGAVTISWKILTKMKQNQLVDQLLNIHAPAHWNLPI
uniref:Pyrin domain-containing protein n=1 Tax=Esox lucius TaxID=8010 RepID=A0AAY5KW60_ESOLU